jgi:GLPGLI family protein
MTKSFSIQIFVYFIAFSPLFAQKSQQAFFYKATYVSDSTDKDRIGEDLMVLWWGDTHSVFESYYGFRIDSVTKIKASNITTPNASNIAEVLGQVNSMKKPAFRYFVHKATTKGVITVYDKLFFDNYKYTQPLAMTSWKIHPESKTILGFKTQKATIEYSGRKFIAWFAEDIPISDGPYVFNGLPGLILEITDDKGYFHFELVGLEKREIDLSSRTLDKTISLGKKDYFALRREMYADVRKAFLGKPEGSTTDEAIREVQARYNKVNNPLELKVD